jgi:geranylgeranyl diphosphate synthase, type I
MIIEELRADIEQRLGELLARPQAFDPTFREMLATLYGSQKIRPAKRLRPILLILGARLAGGSEQDVIELGLALELLHDFSAILDDIMDRDVMRRGVPATWVRFGSASSITMAGGVYTLAVRLALQWLAKPGTSPDRLAAADRLFAAAMELHDAQLADLATERSPVCSLEDCLRTARGRSILLGAAPSLGAQAAGAPAEFTAALERLSAPLAMAYSLIDDARALIATNDVAGKVPNGDIRRRKKTYPIVAAFEALSPPDKTFVEQIWQGKAPLSDAEVTRVRLLLEATDGIARTLRLVETLVGEVQAHLAALTATRDIDASRAIQAFLDNHFHQALPAMRGKVRGFDLRARQQPDVQPAAEGQRT